MSLSAHPSVMGTEYMVVSGHPAASLAGSQILEAGGNAVDAGVAIGLCINVLESEMTGFAGVAPTMLRMAADGEVRNFVGVGPWPKALDAAYFRENYDGLVPPGILDTVVPAAPDIWLTALQHFGTLSFGEVAETAIRLACDGFPMYPFMIEAMQAHFNDFSKMPGTAAIYCPNGDLPKVGDLFVQAELACTLQFLVDEERKAASNGRHAGIDAARRAFYKGDIAVAIIKQQEAEGGFMTREDLASFRSEIEVPTRASFGDYELYGCGPWCQGPMIIGAAQILSNVDLGSMGHNSANTIHYVTEALKLSAADREAYFGDPAQMKVPLDTLLDPNYSRMRRDLIQSDRAHPGLPNPGKVDGFAVPAWQPDPSSNPQQTPANSLETSYFCVIDKDGNLFSATPSDPTISGEVVPGLGITTSRWGTRAHTGGHHPARVGPGWRPRMSANPMLAIKPGEALIPIGSPGSEVLGQAQLQVMLNMLVFGMSPQPAVEAARFACYSWPASALPHTFHPARLNLEADIGEEIGKTLANRGHDIRWWPERIWRAGSVCTIWLDQKSGVLQGGADPRRNASAIGR